MTPEEADEARDMHAREMRHELIMAEHKEKEAREHRKKAEEHRTEYNKLIKTLFEPPTIEGNTAP